MHGGVIVHLDVVTVLNEPRVASPTMPIYLFDIKHPKETVSQWMNRSWDSL